MFDKEFHTLCQACGLQALSPLSEAVGPCAFVLNQGNSRCFPHRETRFMQLCVAERSCYKAPPSVLITEVFMEAVGPATRNLRHGCYGTVPHPLSVWWDGLIIFLPVKYGRWHSHNSALQPDGVTFWNTTVLKLLQKHGGSFDFLCWKKNYSTTDTLFFFSLWIVWKNTKKLFLWYQNRLWSFSGILEGKWNVMT